MADLVVELYGKHVGRIVSTSAVDFDFVWEASAFESFELGSTVLSAAIPSTPCRTPKMPPVAATSSPSCSPRATHSSA